jgi:hypothetical protein
MLVKARFVGEDGSLGYRHGKEYTLKVSEGVFFYALKVERTGLQKFMYGAGACPYKTVDSFKKNWQVLD